MQADCYNDPHKKVLPITPAFCFAHTRRGFFELADIEKNAREGNRGKPVSPIALEAVRRIDALFEIERAINGRSADERYAMRQEKSKPLLDDMHAWLLRERNTLSRSSEVLKPINYMLRRWADFAPFSTTAESASATPRPKERCVALLWEDAAGHSPVPSAAPTAPPSCLPSSPRHASTTSTRKPGSHCRSSRLASARTTALGMESACAKPTSPPISGPPDLHATPSWSPPRQLRVCQSCGLRRMHTL